MTGGHALRALTEQRSFAVLVVAVDEQSFDIPARALEVVGGIPRHAASAAEAIACMEQAEFDVLFVNNMDCCGVTCQEIVDFIDEERDARIPVVFRACDSTTGLGDELDPKGLYIWILEGVLQLDRMIGAMTKAARLSRLLRLEQHVEEEVDWRVAYCLSQFERSWSQE